jgi:hypothetical protein
MDILERLVSEALRLILTAETLAEGGTAQAWEVARHYERAARLLELSGAVCKERARGRWQMSLERTVEGRIVQVWSGAGRIRSEEQG